MEVQGRCSMSILTNGLGACMRRVGGGGGLRGEREMGS
jgi:hypothetical protein